MSTMTPVRSSTSAPVARLQVPRLARRDLVIDHHHGCPPVLADLRTVPRSPRRRRPRRRPRRASRASASHFSRALLVTSLAPEGTTPRPPVYRASSCSFPLTEHRRRRQRPPPLRHRPHHLEPERVDQPPEARRESAANVNVVHPGELHPHQDGRAGVLRSDFGLPCAGTLPRGRSLALSGERLSGRAPAPVAQWIEQSFS